MAVPESIAEKKQHGLVNGFSAAEEPAPAVRPKTPKKGSKKSRVDAVAPSVRYFLAGDSSSSTPQLTEERPSELEAIADAFRKQVSFFVVQEFSVDMQNHNGAPLLRKTPVKDRSSP